MKTAHFYPEHGRTSCGDGDGQVVNATAEGSTGCERCTAILLDHRETMIEKLQDITRRMHARLVLRSLISNAEWTAIADELDGLWSKPPAPYYPEKDEDA